MANLEGKIALVTGASRGIGRASALALAKEGAHVLVHYGRGKTEAFTADLESADGPHKLASQVRGAAGDRQDIPVAKADVAKSASIEDTTVADFDRLFAVNVRAPFFLVQQTLPLMASGGSIIFVSSLAAHAVVGTPAAYPATTYSATQGAVDTLVKHFAAALGPRGIRVNAVAPGVVDTDMSSFARTVVRNSEFQGTEE